MEYQQAIKTAKEIFYLLRDNKTKITLEICKEKIEELNKENFKYEKLIKEYKSNVDKTRRIKKRIKKMFEEKINIYFITYTINNENLDKNHIRKLRDINKGLNYIINVDYGKENGRKHYHGIIQTPLEPPRWNYGFCKIEKINKKGNEINIAKYINKLTNHTIKDTTKKERIIYSRCAKKTLS